MARSRKQPEALLKGHCECQQQKEPRAVRQSLRGQPTLSLRNSSQPVPGLLGAFPLEWVPPCKHHHCRKTCRGVVSLPHSWDRASHDHQAPHACREVPPVRRDCAKLLPPTSKFMEMGGRAHFFLSLVGSSSISALIWDSFIPAMRLILREHKGRSGSPGAAPAPASPGSKCRSQTYFQTMAFSLALYLAFPFMQITCTPLVFRGVGIRTWKTNTRVALRSRKETNS